MAKASWPSNFLNAILKSGLWGAYTENSNVLSVGFSISSKFFNFGG
jgi:hypothetical protein